MASLTRFPSELAAAIKEKESEKEKEPKEKKEEEEEEEEEKKKKTIVEPATDIPMEQMERMRKKAALEVLTSEEVGRGRRKNEMKRGREKERGRERENIGENHISN